MNLYEIFDQKSGPDLDKILVDLCAMIVNGKKKNPDYYGMVAAAVVDPEGNVVKAVNHFDDATDKRIHAERAAVDLYLNEYGNLPEDSIIVTTLSPCNESMADRLGSSCKDLINQYGISKVYCGYIDPTQENTESANFEVSETNNEKLRELCKQFADTFLQDTEDES